MSAKNALAAVKNSIFTPEQLNIIKRTIAKDATIDEFALFIGMCNRTQLDPLTKQIYFIKDKGNRVMTQVSIDGFRVIAQRSGDYAGQDAPVFETKAGPNGTSQIVSCAVTVYRWHGDNRYAAATGVAYWEEYNRGSVTWKQMPRTMLSKVAEAIALRKAFPNDLSGLYAPEEGQAIDIVAAPADLDTKKATATALLDRKPKSVEPEDDAPDYDAMAKDAELEAEEARGIVEGEQV